MALVPEGGENSSMNLNWIARAVALNQGDASSIRGRRPHDQSLDGRGAHHHGLTGAPGHSDCGYGYVVGADNQQNLATWRLAVR